MFSQADINSLFMNDGLSRELSDWLNQHGVKKTELAAALKIKDSQVITNWIGRGSVPKNYIDQVRALIGSESWPEAKRSIKDIERHVRSAKIGGQLGRALRGEQAGEPRISIPLKAPYRTATTEATEGAAPESVQLPSSKQMREQLQAMDPQNIKEFIRVAISLASPEDAADLAEECLKRIREELSL